MEANNNEKKGDINKMTFKGYYDSLDEKQIIAPKSEFIRRIANKCQVSVSTVRMWLYGVQKPDSLKKSIIAKEMNAMVEDLFPLNDTEK